LNANGWDSKHVVFSWKGISRGRRVIPGIFLRDLHECTNRSSTSASCENSADPRHNQSDRQRIVDRNDRWAGAETKVTISTATKLLRVAPGSKDLAQARGHPIF